MPASIKTLSPEEFSEDRKRALREIEERKNKIVTDVKTPQRVVQKPILRRGDTLEIIKQTLGSGRMKRDEILQKSGLSQGRLAGATYKSQKTNGILKFENGYFFIG